MVALEIECACKNALEPGGDCRVSFGDVGLGESHR